MIKDVGIGVRDTNRPILWFDARTLSGCALQVLEWDDAGKLIAEAGLSEVRYLEGKPCVVERINGLVQFKRLL